MLFTLIIYLLISRFLHKKRKIRKQVIRSYPFLSLNSLKKVSVHGKALKTLTSSTNIPYLWELVTIHDELKHVNNYIPIQNIGFENCFNIVDDESLTRKGILKKISPQSNIVTCVGCTCEQYRKITS